MSGLNVEALLEATDAAPTETPTRSDDRDNRSPRADPDDQGTRSRERRRRPDRDIDGDEDMKSPRSELGSANGSQRSRRRSRSRESDRRRPRRRGDDYRSSGDFYRGGGRARSRSPFDDRHYRPNRRERDDERRPRQDRRGGTPSRRGNSKSPVLNEDERDKRTIFVQQLAARLRSKELAEFFEKVGPVKDAQIVKDRVSLRSKGYVSFPVLPITNILIFIQCRLRRI